MSKENTESDRLNAVIVSGANYGKSVVGAGKRVLVEFVSAQPNTILTVSHGRGGVIGDTISTLLAATGHDVQREFYVNDAQDSRPMRDFARAVLSVYRQRCGIADTTPETEGYSSDYIATIADRIYEEFGEAYAAQPTSTAVPVFLGLAFARTQQEQRDVLGSLQVQFDNWTSESELARHGAVTQTFDQLESSGRAEQRGGALWLLSTQFGEPHDHVLRRADGSATYLAGDLAYHRGKFERGFERLIDVWSADHSTYVSRTRAGIAALGFDPSHLDILLFQRVRALKDGTEIKGSRDNSHSQVPLSELVGTIGADEARFQLSIEDPGRLLDLNMDDRGDGRANSVGKIKSAIHGARALSTANGARQSESALAEERFQRVITIIEEFPGVVAEAAAGLSPQLIALYAVRLAAGLDPLLAAGSAHPSLYAAAAIALENAFVLLGISPGPSVTEPNL